MELGDRLGLAGLIVALIGIATMYLWPTRKWIGWVCLGLAFALVLVWVKLEIWPHRETNQAQDEAVDFSNWSITGPLFRGNDMSFETKSAYVILDTSYLMRAAKSYRFMLIMRVQDDSVDALNDPRIEKSEPFALTGEVRTIRINLSDEFVVRAEAASKRFKQVSVQSYFYLVPNRVHSDEIRTLADLQRLGGMALKANPPIQNMHN